MVEPHLSSKISILDSMAGQAACGLASDWSTLTSREKYCNILNIDYPSFSSSSACICTRAQPKRNEIFALYSGKHKTHCHLRHTQRPRKTVMEEDPLARVCLTYLSMDPFPPCAVFTLGPDIMTTFAKVDVSRRNDVRQL